MSIAAGVNAAYRGYQVVRKGYNTYSRYNKMYNPIAKFETRLPPQYRKPYRIGLHIGDAILTGGILYDTAKNLYEESQSTGGNAQVLQRKQQKTNQFKQKYRRYDKHRCRCRNNNRRFSSKYR